MGKHFVSFLTIFSLSVPLAWGDIDITELCLQNAGFDNADYFDYRKSDNGNVAQEILSVYGWSKDIGVDYTITGVYEYGTGKTFNTYGKVPSSGYDGSRGGCLALSTGWDQAMKFYQTVTLPKGNYVLQAPFYNGSNSSNGYSLLGWIPKGGGEKLSSLSSFSMNAWTLDKVSFSVGEETTGRIQIGFKAVANGSANSAKVVVDYVRLFLQGENAVLTEEMRVSLGTTIASLLMLYGDGTGREAASLKGAIDGAQAVMDDASSSFEDLFRENSALKQAQSVYEKANAAINRLSEVIEEAKEELRKEGKGAAQLQEAVRRAEWVLSDVGQTASDVNAQTIELETAIMVYRTENATGEVPRVTTDPRHARGATMAFGRASFAGSGIKERGFCWNTKGNPSILDNRSTKSFDNNGTIYVMEDLAPSTVYYIRPYAISNAQVVGYGNVIKICTLPMGEVTWSYNNGGSAEANARINSAVKEAVDIWNNLTSIRSLHISVSYGANTPTADCSYGGSMRVGPEASYQRTGTILHEMAHAAGVGTTDRWYNDGTYREGVSTGIWLGERTDQVMQFLENSGSAHLKGDKTHFWPYGVNGAHEDTGSKMLYYGNSLIVQALGEDFLPPVYGAFASPAYTFTQDDNEYYYIFPSDDRMTDGAALLRGSEDGGVALQGCDWRSSLGDHSFAWQIHFDPESQLYEFRNVQTGRSLSLRNTTVHSSDKEEFALQLLGSRENVVNQFINLKSYWVVFSDGSDRPYSLSANNGRSLGSARFDHRNSASAQRWIILSRQEVKAMVGDYTGIDEAQKGRSVVVSGTKDGVMIESFSQGSWVVIYDVQGRLVSRFYMQAGLRLTQPLAPGVYVVNGERVLSW